MWILNLTVVVLTVLIHYDYRSYLIKLLMISLIPLILQIYFLSDPHRPNFVKLITLGVTLIAILLSVIFLLTLLAAHMPFAGKNNDDDQR